MPDYIDPTNIGQLIDILQSETEGRHFDPTEVQSLDDLMTAVGFFIPRANMSEEEIDYGLAYDEPSGLDDLMTAVGFFIPRANMSEEEIDYGLAYDEAEDQQTTPEKRFSTIRIF